jgi:hypothetical protein
VLLSIGFVLTFFMKTPQQPVAHTRTAWPLPRHPPRRVNSESETSRSRFWMTLTPCKLRSLAVAVLIRRSQRVRSSSPNNSGGARVFVVVTETGCGARL